MKNISLLILINCCFTTMIMAENPPQGERKLQDDTPDQVEYVTDVFRGYRVHNGHSVVTLNKRTLNFTIGHRFGRINEGYSNFFGLDDYANVRMGLDYGLTDRISIGIGRSRFERFHDVYLKYNLMQQTANISRNPFSISAFFSTTINGREFNESDKEIFDFSHRLNYNTQLIIARKFNKLSLQIMPSYVHQNMTQLGEEENSSFALGAAGRLKITNTTSLVAEYYYNFSQIQDEIPYYNPISVGLDFETFNHMFSLFFTNSTGLLANQYITNTSDNFFDGEIHFGFTISRYFFL